MAWMPARLTRFQSTLPVWGATASLKDWKEPSQISIHAPRVGSDCWKWFFVRCFFRISIHAPRVGSDGEKYVHHTPRKISIHAPRETAVWGATRPPARHNRARTHFNPRSPCGERRGLLIRFNQEATISIHAPRVGSDVRENARLSLPGISIHAPRVGSDYQGAEYDVIFLDISIHAPRVGSDL